MTKMEFAFLSLSYSIDVIFESTTSIDEFSNDFMFLFVKEEDIDRENHKINIQSLQQNTPALRHKVDEFIDHYKNTNIKVFQLRSYFQKLSEGENFLIWPPNTLTSNQRLEFYNYLSALQEGKDYETVKKQMSELFGELKNIYSIEAFDGSTKRPIGEQDKLKRVCRFCNNTRTNVSFKNVAHAISESLGNKTIILNEECDECNSNFGSATGIESSLITFLKFYSIFYGIKGKNGIPKMKGRNFELSNDGQIEIKYYTDSDEYLEKEKDLADSKFRLDTYENIVMQDIYKALCKYFLSLIDASILQEFQDTINWINGKVAITKLPRVAILTSYNFFKTHPSLIVYLRQDSNTELPYAVGEFHHTFLTFVFIIPLTKSDNKNFTVDKDYDKFWDFFKHYSMIKEWDYRDFSDNTKRRFTLNLNLNFKQSGEKSTNA